MLYLKFHLLANIKDLLYRCDVLVESEMEALFEGAQEAFKVSRGAKLLYLRS